jgi:hypothetical protein
MTLENTECWRGQKSSIKTKGNQILTAIDVCLATALNMKVRTLENIYDMLCERKIMYDVEFWGLDEACNETDKITGRVYKKILGLPRCTANGVVVMELGRDSKRGKAMRLAVKLWQQITML